MAYAKQITVKLRKRLEWANVYFSPSIPGGYAWLFPKKELANAGVSMDLSFGGSLTNTLEQFRKGLLREGMIEEGVMRTTGGAIPAEGPRLRTQHKNLLLVGDAAGHTHPISGEGIFPAIVAGKIAGSLAAKSICAGDPNLLSQYPEQWSERLGGFMQRGLEKKLNYHRNWGKEEFSALVRKSWFAFPEYFK